MGIGNGCGLFPSPGAGYWTANQIASLFEVTPYINAAYLPVFRLGLPSQR
ncbi:hypothetical protein [Halochromatium salexigens]|nr:hypothetical protein [Halochromatium salexigens]